MGKSTRTAITVVAVAIFMWLGVIVVGGGSGSEWGVEMLKFGGAAVLAPLLAWMIKEYRDDKKADERQARLEEKLDVAGRDAAEARRLQEDRDARERVG